MTNLRYRHRIDALEMVWRRWADIGVGLSEQQWSTPTRCVGWDVAALYAHVGMFPPRSPILRRCRRVRPCTR